MEGERVLGGLGRWADRRRLPLGTAPAARQIKLARRSQTNRERPSDARVLRTYSDLRRSVRAADSGS